MYQTSLILWVTHTLYIIRYIPHSYFLEGMHQVSSVIESISMKSRRPLFYIIMPRFFFFLKQSFKLNRSFAMSKRWPRLWSSCLLLNSEDLSGIFSRWIISIYLRNKWHHIWVHLSPNLFLFTTLRILKKKKYNSNSSIPMHKKTLLHALALC